MHQLLIIFTISVTWLRLWNCKTAWSMPNRSLREPKPEKKAEELMQERISRTEWMNTTTLNQLLDKPRFPWSNTGGSTHYHSQMETLAKQILSTEESLIRHLMMLNASGFHQQSEVIRYSDISLYGQCFMYYLYTKFNIHLMSLWIKWLYQI